MPRWSQQDKFRIAERRTTVASLYLRGKFQAEIAKEVNVDRGTVSRDLKAVEAEWVKSGVTDLNTAKARELASKLTPEQRRTRFNKGMAMIYGGANAKEATLARR